MASLYYTGKHFGALFVSVIAAVLCKSLESHFPLYFASKELDSYLFFSNKQLFRIFNFF